ncbi:MAG: hypothetical protein RLP09_33145 [Sandaracinaceae bacterium]|nr:hypothetical protein [Myxococcales bacterium]
MTHLGSLPTVAACLAVALVSACASPAPPGDGGALDASPDAWIDGTIAEGCAGEPPQLSCFGAWPGCCDEGPSPTTGECDPELARWSCPAGTFDHCDCGPPPDAGP